MGIVFALIAALSQSILWIALKKSYENLAPSIAFLFDMILGVLIWIPFSLHFGIDFSHISQILLYAFVSGILSEAFVFYAFSKGEVSYTSTIFSTYPVFTICFSLLLNHEHLLTAQWVFV